MKKRIYMKEASGLDPSQKKIIFDGPVREFVYEDQDILGEGASFVAYSGTDYTGSNIVLKESRLEDEGKLWKQKTLYTILRNLTGFHTLRIHGIFREEKTGKIFISQDRIQGKPFTLANYPTEDLVTELECIESLLKTMKILAENGYLFLDVKPDNLFRLEGQNDLLLFDMDSVTTKKDAVTRENIVSNMRYAPQEIRSDEYPISESTCTYMAMYLLMERLFDKQIQNLHGLWLKRNNPIQAKMELIRQSKAPDLAGCSATMAEKIYDFLAKEWNRMPYERSRTIAEVLDGIEELKNAMKLERSKAVLRMGNESSGNDERIINTHRIYEILMDYPVYEYYPEESDLNILIAGESEVRTQIVECVISCVQMLDRRLNLYICGGNTLNFWRKMEKERPELSKVITKWENEKPVKQEYDHHIVAKELANVNLFYPKISCRGNNVTDDIAEDVMERIIIPNGVHYIFAVYEQEEKNVELLNRIVEYQREDPDSQKYFLAYYGKQELDITRIDCKRIPDGELKSGELFSSYLYRCALQVHNHYNIGINNKKKRQRLETEFKDSLYYAYASERPVVHMHYALKSVSLNRTTNADIAVHYTEAIQKDDILRKLIWLEHLSWTAYQVMCGNQRATLEELKEYLFQDGNDWKKVLDNGRVMHPCIVSSSIDAYGIKETLWDDESAVIEDGLNEVSVSLYRFSRDQAYKNREQICECIAKMQEDMRGCRQVLQEETERFFASHRLNLSRWNEALEGYRRQRLSEEKRKELIQLMRPAVQASQKRDFKNSDAGGIRLFALLLQMV